MALIQRCLPAPAPLAPGEEAPVGRVGPAGMDCGRRLDCQGMCFLMSLIHPDGVNYGAESAEASMLSSGA